MPEVLTRKSAPSPSAGWPDKSRNGGRLHVGMLAGFTSEPWPASRRNTRPACVGIRTRLGIAELMFMVLRIYRDVGVRMILIDEAHNMLSGSPREQRRILTHLRYLSNELRVTLVCFGTVAAREAIASDPQLARRFGQYELPAWQADGDFESLVATALHHMPLTRPSVLSPSDLRTIVGATRGNTARVFQMLGDLSVRAIVSGEERVTPEMVAAWRPSIFDRDISV